MQSDEESENDGTYEDLPQLDTQKQVVEEKQDTNSEESDYPEF